MPDTPSAWKIMKALAAWKQAQDELLTISLDDDEGELSGSLEQTLTDIDDVLERLNRAERHAGDMAQACEFRANLTRDRGARWAERRTKLRGIIQALMVELDMKRFERADLLVVVTKGRDGVIVTDEAKVPQEYKVEHPATWSVDKRKLLAALKSAGETGEVIEGAELRNGAPGLTVYS